MKYGQFFDVARNNDGFAELQDFFINFDVLKDIISKLEVTMSSTSGEDPLSPRCAHEHEVTMKDGDAHFKLETEQLRLQFKRVLTEEIMKIDRVSAELVQKLEHFTDRKGGGKAFDLTSPTKDDFKTFIIDKDTGMDVTYRRALLVKQYCELNLEGVRQIAKEYDNRAGCACSLCQKEQSLALVKFLAFADGRIDRLVQQIEKELLAKGEITSEAACRESVMQGILVTGAEAEDVGTVQMFLQVMGMVLLDWADGISNDMPTREISNTLLGALDKMALKEMKASGEPLAEKTPSAKHSAYGRIALCLNKLWQSMGPTSNGASMPLKVR